ncbi:hypothetical protein M3Y94_00183900 [Aphelenchoides besseyi]|nr:hypothetical protein M3Y94_00183900 [Aphelenchoides besseyi]KAI6236857.1 MRNA-capping enzyme [Aphelenchoides besseyi]
MSEETGPSSAKRARKSKDGNTLNGHNPKKQRESLTAEVAQRLGTPKRWIYCPPMGKEVFGFLPIKTPLSSLYDGCLPDLNYRFTPDDVFKYAPNYLENKEKKIGMWIDLTKTDRYYNKEEIERREIKYVKMPLAGHGESPSREDVRRFVQCVHDFRQSNPTDVVVVHCTHGFNRTGFLISAFAYEEDGHGLEYAIKTFAMARPNGIYKDDYLQDLIKMFNEDEELAGPGRPLWENEDQGPPDDFMLWKGTSVGTTVTAQESNGHATNSNENGAPTTSTEVKNGKPQFMEGRVPHVHLVEDKETIDYLRGKIKQYCGYKKNDFPGSQPVSLEHTPQFTNLEFLSQEDYMVSWKADGMRYLVLIDDAEQVYAFDRDNNPFELRNISFPHRKHPRHIKDTLVDAEMVIDTVNGEERPRLLIYDIVHFEETEVGKCDFRVRFQCIKHELIDPREKAKHEGRIKQEPMSIRRKDFFDLVATPKLLDPKFQSQLPHEIDGLIFQPVAGGYVAGRYDKLLKWKPQNLSTIDFSLQIRKEEKYGQIPEYIGYLYVLGLDQPFATIKALRSHLPYNGKIVECNYENRQWKIMRERTDKSHPNAYKTAMSVCRCIESPITTEILLRFISQHCIRPPTHHQSRQSHSRPPPSGH